MGARISALEFDNWVLRGELEDLSDQESCVLNPHLTAEIRGARNYGMELTMDAYNCDMSRFTRQSIGEYFDRICELIGVTPEARYFWDDVGVASAERQTEPKLQGTSAVQFILTSTIVLHSLDQLQQVFVNVFSCGSFDASRVEGYTLKHFASSILEPHVIIRG